MHLQQFQLKEGSLNYDNWIVTPIPMYMRFTMFNWTNPHLMKTANYTPNFVEMGPYVFRETHERVNVTFNRDNDTVSFYQRRTWHFESEMSDGSLDDKVTNVDTIFAVSTNTRKHSSSAFKDISFLTTVGRKKSTNTEYCGARSVEAACENIQTEIVHNPNGR